jgi:hypothetical protein
LNEQTDARLTDNEHSQGQGMNGGISVSQISIVCYNVEGLLSKIADNELRNYLDNFHFVCLPESHMLGSSLDDKVFKNFSVFTHDGRKLSRQGRLSGGIVVLIRKDIIHCVKQVDIDVDNVLAFHISKELLGLDRDVMVVCTYLPPYDSKFWQNTEHGFGIELVEKTMLDLYDKYTDFHFLICGDLNARTASRNYIPISDDNLDDFTESLIPETDFPRQSVDLENNMFGEQLLELCAL